MSSYVMVRMASIKPGDVIRFVENSGKVIWVTIESRRLSKCREGIILSFPMVNADGEKQHDYVVFPRVSWDSLIEVEK